MQLTTRIAFVLILSGTLTIASMAQQPASALINTNSSSSTQVNQAQTSTPSQPTSPTARQPPSGMQQPLSSEQVLRQEESQRALGVVPMFGMTSIHNAPALSPGQKFQLMARTMTDPFTFVAAGFTAGVGQATGSFSQYGQGASGFGKRYAAALADGADSNFWSNFVYPVLFKEDPRYFRVGEGPIKKRIASSLVQEVVARKDSGGRTFHFANVLGAFTAGTISNAYYPSNDRGVGLTCSRAAIALGYGALGNVFLEFWPDVDHKLFHKHESQANPSEPPGGPPK